VHGKREIPAVRVGRAPALGERGAELGDGVVAAASTAVACAGIAKRFATSRPPQATITKMPTSGT